MALTEGARYDVNSILTQEARVDDSTALPGSDQSDFIDLTADIVAAYVANNSVPIAELPALLSGIHAALAGLAAPSSSAEPTADKATPAQIRKSIAPDALISFIDGKPYKTLKRHITRHGMTIEAYRERYGLPRDYPVVSASYSEQRSALARSLGLGQQRKKAASQAAPKTASVAETIAEPVAEAPRKRGRPKKAAEPTAKPARARKPKVAAAAE